jgi:uncharacterized membrane protein YkvA (DUF1232 family)
MNAPLTTPLDRYLAQKPDADRPFAPSQYVEQGAACVSDEDIARLTRLLPDVRRKIATVNSQHLRRRVDLLAQRVTTPARTADELAACRESAFALYYLLKGYDLVPDSIPEIGFLDDLQVVDAVFRRHGRLLEA